MEALALMLTGDDDNGLRGEMLTKYPTAALAENRAAGRPLARRRISGKGSSPASFGRVTSIRASDRTTRIH
jgi:hypothetical protein